MAKGDTAAVQGMEASYLHAANAEAEWELAASDKVLGRKLPFVLLMHNGAFDARMLPPLLAQYKAKGFTFVTLEAAERDPFYAGTLDATASRAAGLGESVPVGAGKCWSPRRSKGALVTARSGRAPWRCRAGACLPSR